MLEQVHISYIEISSCEIFHVMHSDRMNRRLYFRHIASSGATIVKRSQRTVHQYTSHGIHRLASSHTHTKSPWMRHWMEDDWYLELYCNRWLAHQLIQCGTKWRNISNLIHCVHLFYVFFFIHLLSLIRTNNTMFLFLWEFAVENIYDVRMFIKEFLLI